MSDIRQSLQQALAEWYAIERELGHGATATVYLARDLKHNRSVAVKVLSPELALAVRTERFLREIEIAAQLSHPHIVPLYDSGSSAGFLYYVMPYIKGESVRDLLARGGPLPVEEALRIARQVAGALDHAHRHGVIHRDIKPGNILLEEGHARVADFGIARAVTPEDSQIVTQTGVTIGTPAYMSPEQASGEPNLDRRSDIYSLGCVLYEMLAGAPPFTGLNVQSVLTKHLIEPVPPLRETRPDLPEEVEGLVTLALAKNREDRFATAAEFAEALALQGAGPLTPTRTQPVRVRRRVRVRPWAVGGVGGAFVVAAVFLVWKFALGGARALDPTAYFVAPFARAGGVPSSLDAGRLLQDALNEWNGIKVTGRFEEPSGQSPRDAADARRMALSNRAGHYVRGEVSPVGDSIRVRAALYTTSDGALVRERAVTLGASLGGADSLVAALADRVLFDDTVVAANGGRAGTRSVAARQAFAQGLAAVQQWDLTAADTAFRQASDLDPGYTQAHLWVAQVRFWGDAPVATWRSSAERAGARRDAVSSTERTLSDALVTLGRGDVGRACSLWDRLTTRNPADFSASYGLATCLRRDLVVIRDAASPSGWRFRSSYHHALEAYQRAFRLLPAIHKSLRNDAYASARRLLITSTLALRLGHALPPDTTAFNARLAWQGDSLVFIPYRVRDLADTRPWLGRQPPSVAIRHQRALFHEIATSWVTAFPRSPDAMEALAVSLEMLGDPSARDTLRRARSLTSSPSERLRLAAAEAWLVLKYSIPDDLEGVRTGARLADSVLRSRRSASPSDLRLLSSLAAVTGRARLAATLAAQPGAYGAELGPIARAAPPLLVLAAIGGPRDTLALLESQLSGVIDNVLDSSAREPVRMEWLARSATLAFPHEQLGSIMRLQGRGDFLVDAQAAFVTGDSATVRRILAGVHAEDAVFAPADLTLDALYPEAWLLAAMGDDSTAIAWLEPTLNALPSTTPLVFSDPARAGALVCAMALRADLAERTRDGRSAERWARAVAILWSGGDDFLQPTVQRMQRLER